MLLPMIRAWAQEPTRLSSPDRCTSRPPAVREERLYSPFRDFPSMRTRKVRPSWAAWSRAETALALSSSRSKRLWISSREALASHSAAGVPGRRD